MMNNTTTHNGLPKTMTAKEVASLLRITEQALANDRHLGRPTPIWHKDGRRVIYFEHEVAIYLKELPTFEPVGR